MRVADLRIDDSVLPSPTPPLTVKLTPTGTPGVVALEVSVSEQPADIPPPTGPLSGGRGLVLALVALLVAGAVTVLILRRKRG